MRWPFKRGNSGLADKVPDGGLRRFLQAEQLPRDLPVNQIPLLAIDFETTGLMPGTDKVISVQSGIPKELLNAGKALDDLAQDVNKSVLKTYNSFVGLGQDYSAQEVNQILSLSQKNATQTKKNMQKIVADFKKSMSNNDAAQELVKVRKAYKASLYSSYELIVSIIPKMRLALNTFANSIISPAISSPMPSRR